MKNHFRSADILLPQNCSYQKWAVIACDQYTSQPQYWQSIREFIGCEPSTIHMFFPEAEIPAVDARSFETYVNTMQEYQDRGLFREYKNQYIYVERVLQDGSIRQGIVGIVDLEHYDYAPKSDTKIFATEATVLQRVPPRIALRKQASLEFSHVVMFCDDPDCSIVEPVGHFKDRFEKLYDFDLMTCGGHISGYLLDADAACKLEEAVSRYEQSNAYFVGDGNHALVTAKLTYNALKEANPDRNWEEHPARYALVELENIYSPSMVFEPIYRISVCKDPMSLVRDLQRLDTQSGTEITWICGKEEGCIRLPLQDDELAIEALQRFLERWTENHDGTIDYIHGADTVRELARNPGTVGYLVPDIDKSMLAPYILSGKVMPKKTFSIGHALEKRYYLEGRKIR